MGQGVNRNGQIIAALHASGSEWHRLLGTYNINYIAWPKLSPLHKGGLYEWLERPSTLGSVKVDYGISLTGDLLGANIEL